MIQTERRQDPYPLTWEIPLGAATGALLLAGVGVHLGRAIANWFAGAGWAWPTGRAVFTSIPAALAGNPSAGLRGLSSVASPAAVTGWIIVVELLALIGVCATVVLVLLHWGPAQLRGMATPSEAEVTLGRSRLRRVRQLIRPDLYPTRTTGSLR